MRKARVPCGFLSDVVFGKLSVDLVMEELDDDDGGGDVVADDAHPCRHRHPRRLHNIDLGWYGKG